MVAACIIWRRRWSGRAADDIAGALAAMDGRMYGNHGAKAAIEIALHDLVGRATSRPVHALLGDKRRSRMALLGVIGGGDLDGDLRDAGKKKADGFSAFKIKVGIDTPASDAERTRAICQLLGDRHADLGRRQPGLRHRRGDRLCARASRAAGLDFFEQPVAADDLAGMAEVAAATDIAIGADEGIHSLDDIRRHHDRKAPRAASASRPSSSAACARWSRPDACAARSACASTSPARPASSSIACAAALHVAAVIPDIAWGLTLTNAGLGEDVTAHPIPIERGHADVLDRPASASTSTRIGCDAIASRVRCGTRRDHLRHRHTSAHRDHTAITLRYRRRISGYQKFPSSSIEPDNFATLCT